jgi:hypothetical protein
VKRGSTSHDFSRQEFTQLIAYLKQFVLYNRVIKNQAVTYRTFERCRQLLTQSGIFCDNLHRVWATELDVKKLGSVPFDEFISWAMSKAFKPRSRVDKSPPKLPAQRVKRPMTSKSPVKQPNFSRLARPNTAKVLQKQITSPTSKPASTAKKPL